MIQLTRMERLQVNPSNVLINPSHVISIEPNREPKSQTRINCRDGMRYQVQESYDAVVGMITKEGSE